MVLVFHPFIYYILYYSHVCVLYSTCVLRTWFYMMKSFQAILNRKSLYEIFVTFFRLILSLAFIYRFFNLWWWWHKHIDSNETIFSILYSYGCSRITENKIAFIFAQSSHSWNLTLNWNWWTRAKSFLHRTHNTITVAQYRFWIHFYSSQIVSHRLHTLISEQNNNLSIFDELCWMLEA